MPVNVSAYPDRGGFEWTNDEKGLVFKVDNRRLSYLQPSSFQLLALNLWPFISSAPGLHLGITRLDEPAGSIPIRCNEQSFSRVAL
jgi:hypothetical protein